jgi:hypothetical protein
MKNLRSVFLFGSCFVALSLLSDLSMAQPVQGPAPPGPITTQLNSLISQSPQIATSCTDVTYYNYVKIGGNFIEYKIIKNAHPQTVKAENDYKDAEDLVTKIEGTANATNASVTQTMDGTTVTATADTTKVDAANAKAKYQSCSAEAKAAKTNILQYQTFLQKISTDFTTCANTGMAPPCTTALPPDAQNYLSDKSQLMTQASKCQNAVGIIQGTYIKPIDVALDALIKKCDDGAGANDMTVGQAALLGLAGGAIATGVIMNNRGKKRKGDDSGGSIVVPTTGGNSGGTGSNTGGNTGGNGSTVGSTDGCPQGQVRNLNGVCITPQGNSSSGLGAGSQTEPGQTQTSSGQVPINPPPPGSTPTNTNPGGGSPAQGRGLTEAPLSNKRPLAPGFVPGLGFATDSSSNSGGAVIDGPVTQRNASSKFRVDFGNGNIRYLTMKACLDESKKLFKPKDFCAKEKQKGQRKAVEKVKTNKEKLLD